MMKQLNVAIGAVLICLLFAVACKSGAPNQKTIQGKWKSKDGSTTLTIDKKKFTMGSEDPIPEDYFVRGDTIFTSFEGSQPYTRFIIQKLDNHNMNLLYPDSVSVEFTK